MQSKEGQFDSSVTQP
nr:unnamed protein product [Callosobruchus chinensis]CAH7762903.1 unnamed protein product [Callosobruchus chinensis]